MRTKSAILPSHVARTTKYAWAAIAALIVALVLGAFVAPAVVAAKVDPIQRGIDADSARYEAIALAGIQRSVEAGSARWVALGKFHTGIERGIAADTARYQAMALAGIQRSIEAGSARWVALGRSLTGIERGIAADSTRWQAMGEYYVQRGIVADSARWEAMGQYYLALSGGDVLAENPELLLSRRYSPTLAYTDVSKFYAERMRVLAHGGSASNLLAENPELLLARRFSPTLPYTDVSKFYAERMRILAHGGSAVACTLDQDYTTLVANPELKYTPQVQAC